MYFFFGGTWFTKACFNHEILYKTIYVINHDLLSSCDFSFFFLPINTCFPSFSGTFTIVFESNIILLFKNRKRFFVIFFAFFVDKKNCSDYFKLKQKRIILTVNLRNCFLFNIKSFLWKFCHRNLLFQRVKKIWQILWNKEIKVQLNSFRHASIKTGKKNLFNLKQSVE